MMMTKKKKAGQPRAKDLRVAADELNRTALDICVSMELAADKPRGKERQRWLDEARSEWRALASAVAEVRETLFPDGVPAEKPDAGVVYRSFRANDPAQRPPDVVIADEQAWKWQAIPTADVPGLHRKADAILAALPVLANGIDRILDGETASVRLARAVNEALAGRLDGGDGETGTTTRRADDD